MAATVTQADLQKAKLWPAQRDRRRGWPEWVCLALYGCLLASMIRHHEPWADEAQAWMLARSLSLWQLFHTYLHYEGSPGLWHLLLWCLVRLRVSYGGMHWICGLIAVCGVYVLLFYAPFPRWFKFALPFSFFFAYQYAVVARNYVLVPLLLFGVAALWKRSPILLALLLGLLANVAGHTAAISFGFAVVYAVEQRTALKRGEPIPGRGCLWTAVIVLLVLYAAAVWTAYPAPDVWVGIYHLPSSDPSHPIQRAITMCLRSLVWAWDPWPLAFLAWPLIIWGFSARRALHFLVPVACFVLFSAIYVMFWHAGLVVPVIITALWITWPAMDRGLSHAEMAMRAAIVVLISVQIGWTVHAAVYEHSHDYSPDLKAARFLAPIVASGGKVAVAPLRDTGTQAFHTVGIAPYFPGKLYMNQNTPFWWSSRNDQTEANFPVALQEHPRVVLLEFIAFGEDTKFNAARDLAAPTAVFVQSKGYRLARVFCGARAERFGDGGEICHLIFLSSAGSPSRSGSEPTVSDPIPVPHQ